MPHSCKGSRGTVCPEAAVLSIAKAGQPEKVRRGSGGKYWANGATISVHFLDGETKLQEEVKRIAQEWTKYANLKLEFVTTADAEIRVSFKESGSWSLLGTDALAVPKDQPTINFGWINRRTVLHEFGHVLGLIEEHLNPRADIAWNRELISRALSGPPNFWTKEKIEELVFRKVSTSDLGEYRDFDPRSVMNMTFHKDWTGGITLGDRDELSESDQALVARIYPRSN